MHVFEDLVQVRLTGGPKGIKDMFRLQFPFKDHTAMRTATERL